MYEIYAGDELLYSDIYPNHSRKVTSPTLKMAVDGAGSLEFTVSEVNKCYTKLQRMKTIITVKKFDTPIWDGRIVEEYRDFNNNKKMYVEGSLAFLNDTTQPIKEYKNKSLEELVSAILEVHNKLVLNSGKEIYWGGLADNFTPDEIEYWATAYEYTLDTIKNIAEYLECHYVIKKIETTNGSGIYVNKIFFFKEYYDKTNQTITFGKNLLDYTEQYDLSKLATVLLPLAQTDRESADEPNIVGTDIDLTKPAEYDPDKHYGVFMPLTKGVALRKKLGDDNQSYRNKLNVLLENVDTTEGTYDVKGADLIAIPHAGFDTWTIPEYVRIWKYADGSYRDTLSEAQTAELDVDYLSNCDFSFYDFPGAQAFNELWYEYNSSLRDTIRPYTQYVSTNRLNENSYAYEYRTLYQSDEVAFKNIVDDYGILTGNYPEYKTAIIEIDISTYKTLYLTSSNPLSGSGLVTMSLWTRTSASDNDPVYTKRVADILRKNPNQAVNPDPEGYIYAIYPSPAHTAKFYPAFAFSIGYKFADGLTNHRVQDLTQDNDLLPYVLDPDRYSLAKEYDVGTCFARKIDLNYTLPEGKSNRVLLVITTSGVANLTLVSEADKEQDSSVAIGMNTAGIDVSETYPYRKYDPNHRDWIGGSFDPDFIFVESQDFRPEFYIPYAGYGVLTSLTDGVRLLSEQELELLNYDVSLNIFNDGVINVGQDGYTAPANSFIVPVSNEEADYQDYKVCVLTIRNSYIDSDGKKYPNSIYVSTDLKKKTALYGIFEFTDGNGGNGYVNSGYPNGRYTAWDIAPTDPPTPKPQNLRTLCKQPLEFGKYVSGKTTFDGKKITMPYSNDRNRLLMVCIASYGGAPRIYAHDPKLENTVRYLTISSVNNGNVKLQSDSSNIFSSQFEHGDISDQNGSKTNVVTASRIRTVNDITIPADGTYLLSFNGSGVYAKVHINGAIDDYQGAIDWTIPSPYIVLPYLYKDYKLNIVAKKGSAGTETVNTNDITEVMIWHPENSQNMLFTQGIMIVGQDNETIDVRNTQTSDHTCVTTSDYYYVKDIRCDLDVQVSLDTAKIPSVYVSGDNVYPITGISVYITTWYQKAVVVTDENGGKTITYNSITTLPEVGPVYRTQINNQTENDRFRFQIRLVVSYNTGGMISVANDMEMLPEYIQNFSVTPIPSSKKPYVVSNKAFETYGYIEKRIEFDDINSSSELMDRAQKYLNAAQFDEMTLKLKALDMTAMGVNTDNLEVADSINVSSPPHGLYKDFICREMSIPLDKISDTTFELGFDNKDSLSKLIRKEKSKW